VLASLDAANLLHALGEEPFAAFLGGMVVTAALERLRGVLEAF
jgi:hypothetical protein